MPVAEKLGKRVGHRASGRPFEQGRGQFLPRRMAIPREP
jgi:hypothetical protein